ncbi:uncharacterized protein LOC129588926 [Paramacrobiotus metropolitanus]|uniref:uncharacterized protein LOC129588926 n=1 Tax=Paramacrobiotus metropolitanus TaxID=2943436 RepID=UPI0024464E35|nr:uncharacterized protein LOC129588926 [Paramacrobiotus metropolitanus]
MLKLPASFLSHNLLPLLGFHFKIILPIKTSKYLPFTIPDFVLNVMVLIMPLSMCLFGTILLALFAVELAQEDVENPATTPEELLCLRGKFSEAASLTDEEKMTAVFRCFPFVSKKFEEQLREYDDLKQRLDHVKQRRLALQSSKSTPDAAHSELKDSFKRKIHFRDLLWMRLQAFYDNNGYVIGIPKALAAFVIVLFAASVVCGLLLRYSDVQPVRIGVMVFVGVCVVGGLVAYWLVPGMRVERIVREEF